MSKEDVVGSIDKLIELAKTVVNEKEGITDEMAIVMVKQFQNAIDNGVLHFGVDDNCTILSTVEEIVANFNKERKFFSWHQEMKDDYCGWHAFAEGGFKNFYNKCPIPVSDWLKANGHSFEAKKSIISADIKSALAKTLDEDKIEEVLKILGQVNLDGFSEYLAGGNQNGTSSEGKV